VIIEVFKIPELWLQ